MKTGPRRLRRVPTPSLGIAFESEEGRAFFQERLGFFSGLALVISSSFFGAGQVLPLFGLEEAWPAAARFFHLGSLVVLLGTWVACRRLRVPPPLLGVLDAIATLAVCLATWAPAARGDKVIYQQFTMLLVTTNMLIGRAVFVPSTPARTLVIGVLSAAPAVVAGVLQPVLGGGWVWSALWSCSAVTVSTVTSWVIYGLRERVREAVQLGQYRLGERLGMGGMGEVYKASHAMLRRPTAVKLLPPEKTGEQNLQRFEREVQLTSQLTHPNTVSIYDYGRTPSGVFYYAMEYLDGLDLEQLVRQDGAQAPARVVHVLRQVCGSLAEAHAVGLIHRDVKPANIILCERGGEPDVAKVVDFGLVKDLLAADPAVSSAGAIAGTPLYLSPEAISAPELVGPRSDLYALGAVGYHLLTGTHVFESPNLIEVCSHHLHSVPVSPSLRVGRTLAPQLEAVILACLEKDPERRPRDAAALDRALEACADAGVWDREEAKRWWVRFRAGRPSPGASAVPSDAGGRTIQVSLDGRLAATADREVEGTGARATTAGLPAARAPR